MDRVRLLPPETADLIAAGEVVERPASVIKELTENAVDAGATRITVEIKSGGTRYMRVTDNGCGMSRTDAETAFLRHATSKIRTADDLFAISTLGFRGEALAALAAVARVELETRERGTVEGTLVKIEGSTFCGTFPAGCPEGTTVIARELFYNTPARQKFLKKEVTESAAISQVVDKLALSHPEIAITYLKDGRRDLVTRGDGKLESVIYEIYGREIASGCLPVSYEMDGVKVSGVVGKPEASRKNRGLQHFFLNGRPVRGRVFTSALEEAYRNLVMVERYPVCVLNIELDCHLVDVNVHPAKVEVKFTREKPVYDAVYFAALSVLRPKTDRVTRAAFEALTPERQELAQTELPLRAEIDVEGGLDRPERRKTVSQPPREPAEGLRQTAVGYGPDRFVVIPAETAAGGCAPVSGGDEPLSQGGGHPEGPVSESDTLQRRESAQRVAGVSLPAQGGAVVRPAGTAAPPEAGPGRGEDDLRPPLSEEGRAALRSETRPAGGGAPAAPLQGRPLATAPSPGGAPPAPENGSDREETGVGSPAASPEEAPLPPLRVVGELFRCYLVVECGEEAFLIDKHAAHERILFEQIRAAREAAQCQTLLLPVTVTLAREEHALVTENLAAYRSLGFEIEDFGGRAVLVRGVPADLTEEDIPALVIEVADALRDGRRDLSPARYDEILHSIACKAAMKQGQKNAPEDLAHLVRQVLGDSKIRYCPHGRPVLRSFSKAELERLFKRQ